MSEFSILAIAKDPILVYNFQMLKRYTINFWFFGIKGGHVPEVIKILDYRPFCHSDIDNNRIIIVMIVMIRVIWLKSDMVTVITLLVMIVHLYDNCDIYYW